MPATTDFRRFFESASGLFVVLTPDFRIVAATDAWLQAMGTIRENAIDRNLFEILPNSPMGSAVDSVAALRESLEGVLQSGQAGTVPVHVLPSRGAAEERHWILHNSPISGPRGEVAWIVHRAEDVTEFVRLRQEGHDKDKLTEGLLDRVKTLSAGQENLEEQLRQSQKMESVGRLAGGVAHDFNNILTVITGFANMLADRLPEGDLADYVRQIDRSAQRAATLTRQLLIFSRKQTLQPRLLDLNEVVAGMEELVRRLIGDNITLVTVLSGGVDGGICKVTADRGQMEQVVMNLAVNARDAMPNGGRLVIETRNVHPPASLETDFEYCAMLSVSDTGEGMDPETVSHIFEPFFTTKDPGKGTGLGLATVRGVVEQSGGVISVDSKPGRGSTFRVYLPMAEDGIEEERHETSPGPPSARTGTVLVVENEPPVRHLIAKVLTGAHYRVLDAANGHEALFRAAKYPKRIDLLITDVLMPGLSGLELMDELRKSRPGLIGLFISGHDREFFDRRDLNQDVGFLAKPFTPQVLLSTVQNLLASHAAHPRPARRSAR